MEEDDIFPYLYQAIVEEPLHTDGFLSQDDVDTLLFIQKAKLPNAMHKDNLTGYPSARSLYIEIGSALLTWINTSICPVSSLQTFDLLDEKHFKNDRICRFDAVGYLVTGMPSLFPFWNDQEKVFRIRSILKGIGKRGMLDLLGVRHTVGSVETWPPHRSVLELSSNKLTSETKSALSVGARALSKHHQRDSNRSYWGKVTGGSDAQNRRAFEIVTDLLDTAAWINIHELPGQLPTIEIRNSAGYGARWLSNGSEFRGFLEPPMLDGHEVGWKH